LPALPGALRFGSLAAPQHRISSRSAIGRKAEVKNAANQDSEGPETAYSVEKLRITMMRKFNRIFHSPGAQITDQFCRSELRQAGFLCDLCYPVVNTVRNAAQIANEIAAHFKTEFFNRIDQKRPLESNE